MSYCVNAFNRVTTRITRKGKEKGADLRFGVLSTPYPEQIDREIGILDLNTDPVVFGGV